MRYRLSRPAPHTGVKALDRELDVPDALRFGKPAEVQVPSRHGRQVERPEEGHERIDEQPAATGSDPAAGLHHARALGTHRRYLPVMDDLDEQIEDLENKVLE